MKKALPIVLMLAALAAAIVIFLKRQRGTLDLAPGFAAELAPADTVLFLESPDVARTLVRWKETSLQKIAEEPEWKEFTANWDKFVNENEVARDMFGVFGEVQKADPAGLFVAVTSVDANGAKLVGGFPYRGRKSDVEGVVRKLRENIVKAWPAAKSELTVYEGTEVETLKDPKFIAAMAYRDNWFFFATDTDLLLKTLSRYSKKADAPASLAKDPLWKDSGDKGSKDPDLRLWARWSFFADKIASISAMAGPGAVPQIKDPNPIQAITYTWKLDGPLMRDRMFFQTTNPLKIEKFEDRSVNFTSPSTYAYVNMSLASFEEHTKSMLQALSTMGLSQAAEEALSAKGLKLADVFATFGPEITMNSAWDVGGMALPDFFAAVEVKDKVKARAFAELIVKEMEAEGELTTKTEGDTTFWTAAGPIGILRPTIAFNERYLIFGLNFDTAKTALKQLQEKKPNLKTHPGSSYPEALKTVVQPTAMVVYVDLKTLFERLYEKVKPMIAFSLVGNPDMGKHFDSAKLPQAATISKHLRPIVISYGAEEKGWVVEGTGSVSFISAYMLTVPVAFVAVGRQTIPTPPVTATPATPPPPAPPKTVQPETAPVEPAPAGNPPKMVPVPQLFLPVRH